MAEFEFSPPPFAKAASGAANSSSGVPELVKNGMYGTMAASASTSLFAKAAQESLSYKTLEKSGQAGNVLWALSGAFQVHDAVTKDKSTGAAAINGTMGAGKVALGAVEIPAMFTATAEKAEQYAGKQLVSKALTMMGAQTGAKVALRAVPIAGWGIVCWDGANAGMKFFNNDDTAIGKGGDSFTSALNKLAEAEKANEGIYTIGAKGEISASRYPRPMDFHYLDVMPGYSTAALTSEQKGKPLHPDEVAKHVEAYIAQKEQEYKTVYDNAPSAVRRLIDGRIEDAQKNGIIEHALAGGFIHGGGLIGNLSTGNQDIERAHGEMVRAQKGRESLEKYREAWAKAEAFKQSISDPKEFGTSAPELSGMLGVYHTLNEERSKYAELKQNIEARETAVNAMKDGESMQVVKVERQVFVTSTDKDGKTSGHFVTQKQDVLQSSKQRMQAQLNEEKKAVDAMLIQKQVYTPDMNDPTTKNATEAWIAKKALEKVEREYNNPEKMTQYISTDEKRSAELQGNLAKEINDKSEAVRTDLTQRLQSGKLNIAEQIELIAEVRNAKVGAEIVKVYRENGSVGVEAYLQENEARLAKLQQRAGEKDTFSMLAHKTILVDRPQAMQSMMQNALSLEKQGTVSQKDLASLAMLHDQFTSAYNTQAALKTTRVGSKDGSSEHLEPPDGYGKHYYTSNESTRISTVAHEAGRILHINVKPNTRIENPSLLGHLAKNESHTGIVVVCVYDEKDKAMRMDHVSYVNQAGVRTNVPLKDRAILDAASPKDMGDKLNNALGEAIIDQLPYVQKHRANEEIARARREEANKAYMAKQEEANKEAAQIKAAEDAKRAAMRAEAKSLGINIPEKRGETDQEKAAFKEGWHKYYTEKLRQTLAEPDRCEFVQNQDGSRSLKIRANSGEIQELSDLKYRLEKQGKVENLAFSMDTKTEGKFKELGSGGYCYIIPEKNIPPELQNLLPQNLSGPSQGTQQQPSQVSKPAASPQTPEQAIMDVLSNIPGLSSMLGMVGVTGGNYIANGTDTSPGAGGKSTGPKQIG